MKFILIAVISALFSLPIVSAEQPTPLEIGAELPEVSVPNQDDEPTQLADYRETEFLLIFFYPKADTPGCTAQACSLRDSYAELAEQGVVVFGVSTDSPEKQKAFQEKYDLPFALLADQEAKVASAFGVPMRGQFTSRQAYLFENGKLVWMDAKASTKQQASDVLAALDER